jgi:hypothetical protein
VQRVARPIFDALSQAYIQRRKEGRRDHPDTAIRRAVCERLQITRKLMNDALPDATVN